LLVDSLLALPLGHPERPRGLVVAGTGNGSVHQSLEAGLLRAQAAGVRVLRSSRCPLGQVLPVPGQGLPVAAGLSPVKARLALMLALLD
jgi:L-asparaginase